MGKRKDISREKRARIQALLELGLYSHREIAAKENVSHQTVGRVAKSIAENLPSTSTGRTGSRGIRKTSAREDRLIVRKALENRQMSVRELKKNLQQSNINISERTLKSRLYEANLKSRRPAKKPRLTFRMKKARLQWAKQHQHFTVEDWEKVTDY